MRDLKTKNIIDVIYSPTEEMIGDMTKPLPKVKFEYCRNLMHLSSIAKRGVKC